MIKTKPPGPKARMVVRKTKKFCIDTTFAYPLVVKTGSGCYIEDVDGNRYLDFNSNVCSCAVGYGHPEIMKVLKEYSKIGAHKIAGQDFFSEEQVELAQKLVKITPKSLSKVFLINTGAEAVENAIKFAYRKLGPLTGVSCRGAFHGRTIGGLTFTFSKPVQKKNYPQLKHKRIEFCTADSDLHVNDVEAAVKKGKTAFVITEIVQGEGGYRIASKKFIKNIRRVTKENGVPMICDEVQSGLGRTGRWWAFEHYGMIPDIITSAKGLQVGATISSEKYAPTERGAVSSTWGGGHRIDMAVGLKTIEIIEREKLMENATVVGKYILKRLKEMQSSYPDRIIDVDGLGLMLRIDFDEKGNKDKVEQKAFENGLLLLGCGKKSIRIVPPLTIKKDDVDIGLDILNDVIKKTV